MISTKGGEHMKEARYRCTLRLPSDLNYEITQLAEYKGISKNTLIIIALWELVKQFKQEKERNNEQIERKKRKSGNNPKRIGRKDGNNFKALSNI